MKRSKFKIPMYLALASFPVILFVVLTYIAYNYTVKPLDIGEIPFVKRDIAPLRVKPNNPGGAQFSNQDKIIYEQISEGSAKKPLSSTKAPVTSKKKSPSENVFDVIDNAKQLKNIRVKLAVMSSKDMAEKEWQRLVRKYPAQLKGKKYRILMRNNHGKSHYDLEVIALTKEQASGICAKLNQVKQSCTVTR